MARGKKNWHCTLVRNLVKKNLTKQDWKIHKQAHELESLTAAINSYANRRKRSNEDLLLAQEKKQKRICYHLGNMSV
jgi:hypothetical protein